jgi:hypothetical protein
LYTLLTCRLRLPLLCGFALLLLLLLLLHATNSQQAEP